MSSLRERVELVRQRITEACQRSGRDPSSVTLVCVTKGISAETIQQVFSLGVTELGENRVQEARTKRSALGSGLWVGGHCPEPRAPSPEPIRWHLIGHLQSNKAKQAVELFDVIHSVDSQALVKELDRQASKLAQGSRVKGEGKNLKPLEVLIQVNVSGESTKFGCRLEELTPLAQVISTCRRLKLVGLMTMAPFAEDSELARPHFRRLRRRRDDLAVALSLEPSALSLSMGMSQDFEVAIEEGAGLVRIGSAIFGGR